MRILYASERPPYPFFLGGAARCAHKLLHSMAGELGVECVAVGSSDYTLTPWTFPNASEYATLNIKSAEHQGPTGSVNCGYPVHVFSNFYGALAGFVDNLKPEVIWSQLEGARHVLELANAKDIRGVLYVHDAEFDPKELLAIAALGCHVVCSSAFLAEKARAVTRGRAHVVYPASELFFGTNCDPAGYVTMINPQRVKGIDTLFEIARRLPAQRFLLVESWKLNETSLANLQAQLARAPNVSFVHRVSDMRAVYCQTRLLLIPSVWEEGFGMVAIEAQSCGIPVIASARGGLPESVGNGGLLVRDYLSADAWVGAVVKMLDDASEYIEWSGRALRHAHADTFAPTQLARRFLEVCSTPAQRVTARARVLGAARDRLEKIRVLNRLFNQTRR